MAQYSGEWATKFSESLGISASIVTGLKITAQAGEPLRVDMNLVPTLDDDAMIDVMASAVQHIKATAPNGDGFEIKRTRAGKEI